MYSEGLIGSTRRIMITNPLQEDIMLLKKDFEFHELVYDDLLELNTHAKIDTYADHVFLVMNVPKFNPDTENYLLNEFDVILGKDYLIVSSRFESSTMRKLFTELQTISYQEDENYKYSPPYIFYQIIDKQYDNVLNAIKVINKDVYNIQEELFNNHTKNNGMLEKLMDLEMNINFIKHSLLPQKEILEELIVELKKFFDEDAEFYIQDVIFKHQKILRTLSIISDNLQSLTSTYNSLLGLKSNDMIGVLTAVTVILGAVNFIGAIFGMNYPLPYSSSPWGIPIVLVLMVSVGFLIIYIFKKKNLL